MRSTRTPFDGKQVQEIIDDMEGVKHVVIAVDDSDMAGPYLMPKFGPDRRPRSYIVGQTRAEIEAEVRVFDARL